MIGLFLLLLLVSSVVPAFMRTRLAFRRAIGSFLIVALAFFLAALGAFGEIEYRLGGPEALILGGIFSVLSSIPAVERTAESGPRCGSCASLPQRDPRSAAADRVR